MVAKGDIILLKDEQTLIEMMETGDLETSFEVTVARVRTLHNNELGISWTIIEFTYIETILIIKQVDNLKDYRLYYEPDDFEPGDRKDLINNGSLWLFDLPVVMDVLHDDPVDYNAIKFSEVIEDETCIFKIKGGTFSGDFDNDLFMVTEWVTDDNCDNPELIAIEWGGSKSETGGYINLWQGVNISENDIEFMNGE